MTTILKTFQKEDQVIYKSILIQGLKSIDISDPREIINKLNAFSSKYNLEIQVVNASKIATWEHIFFSALSAILAFHQQRNISKNLPFEILLFISGQRQIKIALEDFGMISGENIVIILGNSEETMKQALEKCKEILGGDPSDDIMNINNEDKLQTIQNYYQITNAEINAIKSSDSEESRKIALVKAVLNRIALVALAK